MWLIDTTTLELHDFIDANHAPPYAILSHCWGESEMSFKDFRKKRNCTGPGYQKIVDCCEYVRELTFWSADRSVLPATSRRKTSVQWVWIDTWYE